MELLKIPIHFRGFGAYTPPKKILNHEIADKVEDVCADWTQQRLGIESRYVCEEEKTSDLAYAAAKKAMADAKIDPREIDLILLATSSPDKTSPSTACIVQEKLGLSCPALDINAVCSGFIYGLQLVSSLISSGQYKNILLVAAESYSKITDWNHRNCVFFGDGSGAVVVSPSKEGWVSTELYADGKGQDHFNTPVGGTFNMNGRAVYEFATRVLPEAILKSLHGLGVSVDDVRWVVPHQPSIGVLKKTAELLKVPEEKVLMNMKEFGNTAGASIPMGLWRLHQEKKLDPGDILVMPAVGSGWTWGVSVMRYSKD